MVRLRTVLACSKLVTIDLESSRFCFESEVPVYRHDYAFVCLWRTMLAGKRHEFVVISAVTQVLSTHLGASLLVAKSHKRGFR
mmetsp:Transcript_1664/g.4195  ORF Transcript_1664/g.4195 Transcript_1664/m.4195 type:complete len:83 (+) Transcript_1664:1353-1601(+)